MSEQFSPEQLGTHSVSPEIGSVDPGRVADAAPVVGRLIGQDSVSYTPPETEWMDRRPGPGETWADIQTPTARAAVGQDSVSYTPPETEWMDRRPGPGETWADIQTPTARAAR